jgi:heat shock protein HslJ/LysM repeat protein
MNIRRTILVGIALVLAALMAACAAAAQDPPLAPNSTLAGTEWVLVSLNGNALIGGKQITLRFEEASIDGSGGCNTYGGSYTVSEESLSVSDVYRTEMACIEPKGIMEQEQAYLQALNAATRYRVDGDRLEVYDKAGTQILAFVASTSALAGEEMPVSTTPVLSLDCTLEMDETYPVGEPVTLWFELHNQTDRPVYVLTWYAPLEGIAGDIFQVTRNGEKLPYQGVLAKRGDPIREEYVAIEPGETASADVDLRMGYDLSTPGSYQVQFTTGLRDVTNDASLVPQKRDNHRPHSLSCNTVRFRIVPAPELPTATPTATLVVSKADAEPVPTATSAPASTPTSVPPCAVRTDWFEHIVVRGDTMYNIAQRSGSSVDELAAANCLDDPRRIYVGQKLYIPQPVTTGDSPPAKRVEFYLILRGDAGQSGPAVGCGDSAIAVWRDRTRTGSLQGDIRASLEELFSIQTATYGQSGYYHSLHDADLTVQSVTVDGDTATIELTGTLLPVGSCADAQMQAQILLTVFQYPGVNSVLITVDGKNVKQLFDVSGMVGDDQAYERSQNW